MSISVKLDNILQGHSDVVQKTFVKGQNKELYLMAEKIIDALKKKKKLLLCGNGGSAADAQHIAAEFIARFKKERASLPAIALTTDSSILTALANDYNYETVFKRQVEGLGNTGDILIAISTSGNSKNVLEAAKLARNKGLLIFSFTGESGGQLKALSDINFSALSSVTSHIQEMHITALHAVSEVVEDAFAS